MDEKKTKKPHQKKTKRELYVPELPEGAAEALKGKVPDEVLEAALSKTDEIRAYGLVTIEELLRPPAKIPKDYIYRPRDRQAVEETMFMAFDLIGGVGTLAAWAAQNPTEFFKLYTRMMPEAQKAQPQAPTIQIITGVPSSPLDTGVFDAETGDLDE